MKAMNATAVLPARLCGQPFSHAQLNRIVQVFEAHPNGHRAELARQTCQRLGWMDCRGRPKLMSARVALLRLHRAGWIELPPPRNGNGNGGEWTAPASEDCSPSRARIEQVDAFDLVPISPVRQSRQWNDLIARHHYLGFSPMAGAQLRYLVSSPHGELGAVSFGAAAWKVRDRDQWIGWSEDTRIQQLHRVINNARFLILPWVRCPNLGSRILSRCARQVPEDFQQRYGYRPVLFETFVERDRFSGTVYRASNWHCVGQTTGRGKLDPTHQAALPRKTVWLYPLVKDWRRQLGVPR